MIETSDERLRTNGPVILLRPKRYMDVRGWFMQTWSEGAMAGAGITVKFVQDNQSFSSRAGTLRGLQL